MCIYPKDIWLSLLSFQIVLNVYFYFTYSFMKLSATKILRYQGGKALVWLGTNAQFSSTMGAITMFFLVNYSNLFISKDECADAAGM